MFAKDEKYRKQVECMAEEIGCTYSQAKALYKAGYTYPDRVLTADERKIKALPGIGPKFMQYLANFKEIRLSLGQVAANV